MTPPPPLSKSPVAPIDFKGFQPGATGDLSPKGGNDSKPIFAAKGGSANAKEPAPTDKSASLEELIPSLNDEALFGMFLSTYQPERNKKFLNVTLAILAVKKYLGGDATQSAVAKEKIVAWLSDGALNVKPSPGHQARVNMIAVLARAKNDPGVAEILNALKANYSTGAAAAPVAPTGKTGEELLPALEEKTLFGDQSDAYAKEKNKKYLNLTLSLLALRRFLKGETDQLAIAKEKIVAWRSDASLLQDPVAIKAGRGMKALFDTAVQDKDMSSGLKELRKVLVADYSPKENPPEAKAPPVEIKPPVVIDPPPVSSKLKTPLAFSFVSGKAGARGDTVSSFAAKLPFSVKPPYNQVLKQYSDVNIKADMLITVDNATGNVTAVNFDNFKISGSAPASTLESMFKSIATRLVQNLSFEKNGSDPTFKIKAPMYLQGV